MTGDEPGGTTWRARLRGACAAVVAALLVTASGPADAAELGEQSLADTVRRAKVAGYGDTLAWSRWEAATSRYRLVVRVGDGEPLLAPVAGRRLPFDVDVGPDAAGRSVVVYSRCRREPDTRRPADAYSTFYGGAPAYFKASGCDLYRYAPAERREARLDAVSSGSASEYMPSLWRGSIAFARRDEAGRRAPRLYVRRAGARRSARLPAGRSVVADDGPVSLDLRGHRLAYEWHTSTDGHCENPGDGVGLYSHGYAEEIRVVQRGARPVRIAAACTTEDRVNALGGVAWSGPDLLYAREGYVGGQPVDDPLGERKGQRVCCQQLVGTVLAQPPRGPARGLGTYRAGESRLVSLAATEDGMAALLVGSPGPRVAWLAGP